MGSKEVPYEPGKTVITLEVPGRAALDDVATLLGDAEEHVTSVRYDKGGYDW